ncbi:MAG: hypothetical protein Q9174_007243, partial [Haloplaca sp. 1 TL-2023]
MGRFQVMDDTEDDHPTLIPTTSDEEMKPHLLNLMAWPLTIVSSLVNTDLLNQRWVKGELAHVGRLTVANSGVGYATTNVLMRASEPFHVIMASRSLEKVQAAMSEIQSSGNLNGTLSTIHLELTDQPTSLAAAKSVEETHGHLDALVNNAAVGSMDPDIKIRMQISMDTNVIGPAMVEEAFRPLLLKSQNPYSIYVSSGMGSVTKAGDTSLDHYKPVPGEEAYRSSKAALNMLAILEAKTWGPKGLKVF